MTTDANGLPFCLGGGFVMKSTWTAVVFPGPDDACVTRYTVGTCGKLHILCPLLFETPRPMSPELFIIIPLGRGHIFFIGHHPQ